MVSMVDSDSKNLCDQSFGLRAMFQEHSRGVGGRVAPLAGQLQVENVTVAFQGHVQRALGQLEPGRFRGLKVVESSHRCQVVEHRPVDGVATDGLQRGPGEILQNLRHRQSAVGRLLSRADFDAIGSDNPLRGELLGLKAEAGLVHLGGDGDLDVTGDDLPLGQPGRLNDIDIERSDGDAVCSLESKRHVMNLRDPTQEAGRVVDPGPFHLFNF
jgi:hypothetical protein